MAREFWISKGDSNFCQELDWDIDAEAYKKCQPDGFYDIISLKDSIEGAVHVVEASAYLDAVRELDQVNIALARMFSDAGRLTEERDELRKLLPWTENSLEALIKMHAERDKYRAALKLVEERECFDCNCEQIASEALREGT